MIHLFVVYDNQDRHSGDYFAASQQHLCEPIKTSLHFSIQTFDSNTTLVQLPNAISRLNENEDTPFLIVTYTHGSPDALHIGDNSFVNRDNAYLFGQTLFYACGCFSGENLKQYLINHNCRFFMGYDNRITTLHPETEPIFYQCENSVLSRFLSTDETITKCLAHMFDTYEQMKAQTDIGTAIILDRNLDAFVYQGDVNLTRNDFRITR
jgi:hypothetical protein